MMDIANVMLGLSRNRPIFHSEADFQHALAWQIHEAMPDCQIRLEFKPFPAERMYLDLWLSTAGIALELKYRTRLLETEFDGERFALRNQSAHDVSRYDFLKDIQRLERMATLSQVRAGFAILLTNDPAYWNPPSRPGTADAAFRLQEGRRIGGTSAWSEHTGAGTMKGRETPVRLEGSYALHWRDFATLPRHRAGRFRYLTAHVSG